MARPKASPRVEEWGLPKERPLVKGSHPVIGDTPHRSSIYLEREILWHRRAAGRVARVRHIDPGTSSKLTGIIARRARAPGIVLAGAKWLTAPVTVDAQSSQYVPAGSVMPTVTVFFQILRVVPGAVPGGGTEELKIRKSVESTEVARRLVVVSPNNTRSPGSPGRVL